MAGDLANHRGVVRNLAASHGQTARLAGILVASLDALAAAGEVEAACRLAGQACVALRRADPDAARRFDALLHRLTPKLSW